MTEIQQDAISDLEAEVIGHYNPVDPDTIGVMILGFLAFFLLIALLRSQSRNRSLLAQLSQ